MSHYHIERKRAAVAVFRHAKKLKTEHGAKWLDPIEFASQAAGGASRRQIYVWQNTDLSAEVEEHRVERRGSSPLMSEDQLSLLVGFATFMRTSLRPLSGKDLQEFCTSHLGKTPSLSTISRIMREHGFSSQQAMSRNSRMVSENVVESALDAIVDMRSYELPPDQLLFMDETGLWSNVTRPKTYHFSNWYTTSSSFKITPLAHLSFFCRATRHLATLLFLSINLVFLAHILTAHSHPQEQSCRQGDR